MYSRNVGFEQFLEKNDEEMRHKIVLQLIAIRPEFDTEYTREMAEHGAAWAAEVNARYNYDYIHFEVMTERELRLCTRMAFFAAIDVFVHTTIE
jgi:trehalose-6-phosphate synthase